MREATAFSTALLASPATSSFSRFVLDAFAQPELSSAMVVIEKVAMVSPCRQNTPSLFASASTVSSVDRIPAAV